MGKNLKVIMKNNHNLNYEQTQLIEPKTILTNTKLGSRGFSYKFVYLLTQRPLLLLGGFFTMILGVAALALYSLSYAGWAEKTEPKSVAAEEPITNTSDKINPIPLWMVMAIALSCGSGCYVIFRFFNRPKQPHKTSKRHDRRQKASLLASQSKSQSQIPNNIPLLEPLQPLTAKNKSLMTVLPPAKEYRLDKGKESLADLMDIRKENSLSALLKKH
jgi:hypothetical protein